MVSLSLPSSFIYEGLPMTLSWPQVRYATACRSRSMPISEVGVQERVVCQFQQPLHICTSLHSQGLSLGLGNYTPLLASLKVSFTVKCLSKIQQICVFASGRFSALVTTAKDLVQTQSLRLRILAALLLDPILFQILEHLAHTIRALCWEALVLSVLRVPLSHLRLY